MIKLFLDTNIILDVLCQRAECALAATILNLGALGKVELYITNLTLANVLYITRKELGKEASLEKMKQLCSFLQIAPCGQIETDKAFSIVTSDFEDALQYFSAEAVSADFILTRNGRHFKFSTIPVMDCATYLARY